MCTALNIKSDEGHSFFGRNMDLEYEFNQSVLIIPRGYEILDRVSSKMIKNNFAIIAMGTIIDKHPALADGMNEHGLACAGLNFPGYAYYEEKPVEGKNNIAPYDLIQWVLSNYKTTAEVKEALKNLELVNIPINDKTPVSTLHWIVADKDCKSIVIEKTKNSFSVYDNPVHVLTNNPTFDWHLTNLNEYINLSQKAPKDVMWSDKKLSPLGAGAGNIGIPGDFASVSRFVRIAYLRANMTSIKDDTFAVSQFFNMLDYVKMVKGGVVTKEGMEDITLYSSCMNQSKGIYYYKTYDNNRINAIDMHKENLDSKEIKLFPYLKTQDINFQN